MQRRPDNRFPSAKDALDMLDLVDRSPKDAMLALGKMDVDKALAVISLPKI
jgi:hypothetical protein